jgi:nucleoside-diphosphate-sugar epimerase
MMFFVIGGNGLVGSAVVRHLVAHGLPHRVIQRENRDQFFGEHCDVLINCNGNGSKYKASLDPLFDFEASLGSVATYTHKIKADLTVLISTVIVYSRTDSQEATQEDVPMEITRLGPYGVHKAMAEQYVRRFAGDYLILRLPGLVGPGLRRNPVYDLLTPGKRIHMSARSRCNYIHTDKVADAAMTLINGRIKNDTFNIAARDSLKIGDLEELVGIPAHYAEGADEVVEYCDINIGKISAHMAMPSSAEGVLQYAREHSRL